MRGVGFAALLLTALAGGCRGRGGGSAAPPCGAPASAFEGEAPVAGEGAGFRIVRLFDLQQKGVSRFAFCKQTRQLFVSFRSNNKLYQYSVADAALVHTYHFDAGFMVDGLHPSQDCRLLVVGLLRTNQTDLNPAFERHALVDAAAHATIADDLAGIGDERAPKVEFSAKGDRIRFTTSVVGEDRDETHVFDDRGRPARAEASDFVEPKQGPVRVIQSSKLTWGTHGLHYTDADGKDYRITDDNWGENNDITKDGRYVVTTNWGGEVLAWSTAAKWMVYRRKIAAQYGYLAYDEKDDRFLIADATDGTSCLRALVRADKGGSDPLPKLVDRETVETVPLPGCTKFCGVIEPGVQTCVGCGRGKLASYLSLDGANVEREILVGLWRSPGLDKFAAAECLMDAAPEAAGRPSAAGPYLRVDAHVDVGRDGKTVVSSVTLDDLTSADGQRAWPRLRPVIAACLERVLRPVRLELGHPIEPAKVTLRLDVSRGEEDRWPAWLFRSGAHAAGGATGGTERGEEQAPR